MKFAVPPKREATMRSHAKKYVSSVLGASSKSTVAREMPT